MLLRVTYNFFEHQNQQADDVFIICLSLGAIIIKTNLYSLTWSCLTNISPSSGDPLSSGWAFGPKYIQMMDYWAHHPYKEYIRHCTMEYFRNYKILLGLTRRETIGVYAHLQNINDEIIQLYFRRECNYPEHKRGKCYTSSIWVRVMCV